MFGQAQARAFHSSSAFVECCGTGTCKRSNRLYMALPQNYCTISLYEKGQLYRQLGQIHGLWPPHLEQLPQWVHSLESFRVLWERWAVLRYGHSISNHGSRIQGSVPWKAESQSEKFTKIDSDNHVETLGAQLTAGLDFSQKVTAWPRKKGRAVSREMIWNANTQQLCLRSALSSVFGFLQNASGTLFLPSPAGSLIWKAVKGSAKCEAMKHNCHKTEAHCNRSIRPNQLSPQCVNIWKCLSIPVVQEHPDCFATW